MAQRQPPAGKHEPHDVAENVKRSADILVLGTSGASGVRQVALSEPSQFLEGSVLGQKWPNTNGSFGSRNSAEADGQESAIDRDRGAPHDAAPPTPPYV